MAGSPIPSHPPSVREIIASRGVTQTAVLKDHHVLEIYLLLTKWEMDCADSLTVQVGGQSLPVALGPWDKELSAAAVQAVLDLDALLVRFPTHKASLAGHPKGRGRPVSEENYWLAGEIADILETVPGITIQASKRGPTVFTEILRICFSAIHHPWSTERIALAVSRAKKPAAIDQETWEAYLEVGSKKKRNK